MIDKITPCQELVYLNISSSVIANLSLGNTTGDRNLRDPRFSNQHALQTKLFFLFKKWKKVLCFLIEL